MPKHLHFFYNLYFILFQIYIGNGNGNGNSARTHQRLCLLQHQGGNEVHGRRGHSPVCQVITYQNWPIIRQNYECWVLNKADLTDKLDKPAMGGPGV